MSARSDLPIVGPRGVPLREEERVAAFIRGSKKGLLQGAVELEDGSELRPAPFENIVALVVRLRDDRQPDPEETPGRRKNDGSSIPPDAGPVPGAQTLRPDPEKPNPRKVELPDPTNQPQLDPWKHRSKGMRCATCMFFVPKTPDPSRAPPRRELGQGQIGRCRRHAPTMKGYPAVFETDWCGEHKLDEDKL